MAVLSIFLEIKEKTAVFLCHCGTNIAGVIDIPYLIQQLSKIPNVACFEHEHLCSDDGLRKIEEVIEKEKIKRVLIVACTPSLHERLFKERIEKAGLNPSFVEIVNVREQCSWVHWHDPRRATLKALDLINMALASIQYSRPAKKLKIPIEKAVLIIGGGVAGVTSALNLANMSINVYLVEKSGFLGGHMAKWDKVFPTLDCSICILGPLLAMVYDHPKIKVFTLSEVTRIEGLPGNYIVEIIKKPRFIDEEICNGCNKCLEVCPIEVPNEYEYGIGYRKAMVKPAPQTVPMAPYIDIEKCIGCMNCVGICDREGAINFSDTEKRFTLKVGAIIVATGYTPINPVEIEQYGYGRYLDVVTGPEYERMLNGMGPTKGKIIRLSTNEDAKKIAFIQCVGSRSDKVGRQYCSKVCCMYAIKQAIQTKLTKPDTDITIFYTDIRIIGKMGEEAYRRALSLGVKFVRGRVSYLRKSKTGRLRIFYEDTLECKYREEEFDLVVLSVGMEPNADTKQLASILGLQLDENGFFMEYHPKLNPSDTFSSGIFLAGTCNGPKDITETVTHAGLAASRVLTFLSLKELELESVAPEIDEEKCIHCGLCALACDFGAIQIEQRRVHIKEAACKGCGACLAVCPSGALQPSIELSDKQTSQMLEILLINKKEYPLIVSFMCKWCGYAAADNAGVSKINYPTNVRIIKIPCSVRVNPIHILEALSLGADGVLIVGCHEQDCYYRTGRLKTDKKIENLKKLLEYHGIKPGRVEIVGASAAEGKRLAEIITDFVNRIKQLGPVGSEFTEGS